ncbi:MAG: hypothetical protein ACRC33_03200 [Gemmataceae bacterium]
MNDDTPKPASPLLFGAVGLLLIVGGWKVSTWSPPARESGLFDELRRLADGELRDKLDGYDRRPRPMELPGRLAFFVGVGLFVVGGVKMYRSPAAPAEPEENPAEISSPPAPSNADAHL